MVKEVVDAIFAFSETSFLLKVKLRWSSDRRQCQIKRQCRPGATRWVHPRVPRDGVNTLKLPKEVARLRVQLSSTTFGSQDAWLPFSYFNRGTKEATAVQGGDQKHIHKHHICRYVQRRPVEFHQQRRASSLAQVPSILAAPPATT